MEFRILEIKKPHQKLMYKPQYKNSGWFSSWRNISDTKFSSTIFRHVEFDCWYTQCTFSKYDAEKVIQEFKEYLESSGEYTIVHECN